MHPSRLTPVTRLFAFPLLLALALAPVPAAAQQPTEAQVQAALQQPGAAAAVRARILESGLTGDQIRARLAASGYSPTLLDSYLAQPAAGVAPTEPSADALAAMAALGLAPAPTPMPPVETGIVPAEPVPHSNVFGVDVFRRATTQFLPLVSGPVPPDYRLGPGDALVLILTGEVELTHQLSITREGFVLIPQVGQVFLANLTLDQAKNLLYDRLRRVYSGVTRGPGARIQFELSVANVRAVQVYVIGEVTQPGAYQLSALGTVLTGLYTAGGLTERANLRRVEVRRDGKVAATFDLYDYLLKGDTQNDIRLENGDVVFVGLRERRVTVTGAVQRPAAFDLARGETLRDLLRAAGGFQAGASVARVTIERILPPDQRSAEGAQRIVVDVPLNPRDSLLVPPVAVEDEDRVTVFGVPAETVRYVEVAGSVYLPGRFGLEPGMRLSRLVALAGGLRPATYAGRAHISRLNVADQTRSILPVVLPADSAAPWTEDPVLADRDSVAIYSRLAMRPDRMVTITGAVNNPVTVPWREGMTLRDLVLQANGLAPGAWLDSAEVARLPEDRSMGQLATTIRVALDSTYLFDRDSAGKFIGPPGLEFRPSGAPEVALEPWDNVLILRQPQFEYQRVVTISGEVKFPGTYALRNKDEKLADLVQRAGGLTNRAYPEGIRFVRPLNAAGRIDIDLPQALRHPDSRHNIILQPGDRVDIPEYLPSVKVAGAVNSAGSVLWQKGKKLDDYIKAAGGLAYNADGGRASVRQANGSVQTRGPKFLFFGRSQPTPGPGAEVSVPLQDPNKAKTDYVAIVGSIAQILAATVAIIVVLRR